MSNSGGSEIDAARMRELLANISCPLCGGTRSDTLLVVIDGPAQTTTVRAQCVRCHLFWSFTLDNRLGLTAPVATRSEPPAGPISADEVIELHRLLSRDAPLDQLLYGRAG
ncbi:MAG TPA: hypothetical protein VF160_16035 [Candidatus Dormibacteraeota bacterium]